MTTKTTSGALSFLGNRAHIHADGSQTGGRFGLVELSEMPPDHGPPLHVHHDHDEGFYVLEGELTVFAGGHAQTLRAGDWLLAPRGVPHTYRVGDTPARALVMSAPSGFEGFVKEVSALAGPGPEDLDSIGARYGIEMLGGSPDA